MGDHFQRQIDLALQIPGAGPKLDICFAKIELALNESSTGWTVQDCRGLPHVDRDPPPIQPRDRMSKSLYILDMSAEEMARSKRRRRQTEPTSRRPPTLEVSPQKLEHLWLKKRENGPHTNTTTNIAYSGYLWE